MTKSKYLQDPEFMAHVEALRRGETNRAKIAEALGITRTELSRRFRRAGLLDDLKKTKESRGGNLETTFKSKNEYKQDYIDATRLAIEVNSIMAVLRVYPHLTYRLLAKRVWEGGHRMGRTGKRVTAYEVRQAQKRLGISYKEPELKLPQQPPLADYEQRLERSAAAVQ